jgi:hypothetical protein
MIVALVMIDGLRVSLRLDRRVQGHNERIVRSCQRLPGIWRARVRFADGCGAA